MNACICVDKKNGMMFGGRRQSKDRVQRAEMLSMVGIRRLWVSSYSSSLFNNCDNVVVDDDFPLKASRDDYCFIEDVTIDVGACDSVIIYNWNRFYPSDTSFNVDLVSLGFKMVSKRDFVGYSHERITEEIYRKVN